MKLGLHVCAFNYDGEIGPTLRRIGQTAEQAGVDTITVMDHVFQIGSVGPHEDPMLEAYTALGFLAGVTERVKLGTMVTAAVYRPPGLLIKAVTSLDVLSGGRAFFGIGAAWNEQESVALGLPFPPTAERFRKLEELLQIAKQMWSDDNGAYEGSEYHLGATLNSPQSLQRPHPPILIGGTGEQKTLRMVAQYANACNVFDSPQAAHKLDVLREHCATIGRDYDEIEKTTMIASDPLGDPAGLLDRLRAAHELGFTMTYLVVPKLDDFAVYDKIAEIGAEAATW